MNTCFTVRFSDLDIGIESRYAFMRGFCRDYLSDAPPCFTVRADEADVKRQAAEQKDVTEEYAEALQLYREIAERIPLYDRAVFHGAAVEYNGKAYLFTGVSGVGKSTHIRLWRQYLGDAVKIINGDKPILHATPSGVTVSGTPYAGKEGWQRNASAPLAGICFLSQGTENNISAMTQDAAFTHLLGQIYQPKTETAMLKTVAILRTLSAVPCYAFSCNRSENAVEASFSALTGRKYKGK